MIKNLAECLSTFYVPAQTDSLCCTVCHNVYRHLIFTHLKEPLKQSVFIHSLEVVQCFTDSLGGILVALFYAEFGSRDMTRRNLL